MLRQVKSQKNRYLSKLFETKDQRLLEMQKASLSEGVSNMQISAYEGAILHFLVRLSKATKIVEIGTLYGFSALYLARGTSEKGFVWTLDLSAERQKRAKEILKHSEEIKKIKFLEGPALKSLQGLEAEGPFDMLFIDADKSAYLEYLNWAERNLRPGGLVCADNSFLFGGVYGEKGDFSPKTIEIMKEFNRRISQSAKWEGALLPTEEGMTVAIKS